MNMKDPLERRKIVIRQLPPCLSQSDLFSQIDDRFSLRYNWFCFRPAKSSQSHARAYIELKSPGDVLDFAHLFDGHVFINDKGSQFKAIVEYAPSQRVPRSRTRKDGRQGTIYKDPDYLEFLKIIAKPVENLPSAEIQLERKEAEQSGAAKETPVVTPLMEFVRQKRAAETGPQGSLAVGKISRRARTASTGKPGSVTTKRGSEKKKYMDRAKNTSQKDKSTFVLVTRKEDQPATSSGKEISKNETLCGVDSSLSGITITADSGKKKILLLKGKEREISNVPEGSSQQQGVTSPVGNLPVLTAPRQSQTRETSGRLIRSILLNNEAHQSQSSTAVQHQQKSQTLNLENGKRPHRPISTRSGLNGHVSNNESPSCDGDTKRAPDDKFMKKDLHGSGTVSKKQEKRTRNKDRPDRGVWTTLRRSDVSPASKELLSSSVSQPTQLLSESVEVTHGEMKDDMPHGSRTVEVTTPSSGRNVSSANNGSHGHFARRRASHIMKDDGSLIKSDGKSSKRGGTAGSGAHEKQVWVQKSTSGS